MFSEDFLAISGVLNLQYGNISLLYGSTNNTPSSPLPILYN